MFTTRPRDYYDVYILGTTQEYDKEIYKKALKATAEHRGSTEQISDVDGILKQILESAISRMIVQLIRDDDYVTTENLYEKIELWIDRLDVDYKKWQKGGEYSKYTSGSGYKLVADELISSIRYRY